MRINFFRLFPILFFLYIAMFSCKKDDFSTDSNAKLEFSQDTVLFDTVFTTVGSATEVFTVYNHSSEPVKVSSIRLASGTNSLFRLNVDGISGKEFSDIEIGGKDSIFIFAEVTIDPNNQTTPLVVTDSILFETNGNFQDVDLVAWGQDAYFYAPQPNSSPLFLLDNVHEVWNKDKPHVIYGYPIVDSACSLTINEGTNVYLHPGSGIIVFSNGTLRINGTLQDKVTIQGDRLGQDFKDVPGQWDRIWLSNLNKENFAGSSYVSPGSKNSLIKNAVIKNGNIGLLVDTVFSPGSTTLHLENTVVKNMSGNGIALRGSTVEAFNCVFANCGAQTTNILYGGKYNFYQCTFANFWTNSNRQDPVVSLNNYFDVFVRSLDANFWNCIVYGNLDTEIGFDSLSRPGNSFGFKFDHALLKVENSFSTGNSDHYNSIIRAVGSGNDPRFKDIDNNIYELDSTSIAINAGDPNVVVAQPVLSKDLNGEDRPKGLNPDLGAYERR